MFLFYFIFSDFVLMHCVLIKSKDCLQRLNMRLLSIMVNILWFVACFLLAANIKFELIWHTLVLYVTVVHFEKAIFINIVFHLGCPLVSDLKFGSKSKGEICLHAQKLAFAHPVSKEDLVFESPLPKGFVNEISYLGLKI